MPNGVEWTDAMIARLRELHAQEEYFSDIARMLSHEFGVELTKNACIGKGRRLGLTARARVAPPLPRKGQNRGGPRKVPAVLPGWQVEPPRLPGGKITIYQLKGGLCHYPFGERPPYAYCGHTTRRGMLVVPASRAGGLPARKQGMKYLSICSGIEAASVAWDDWDPAAFAEVEPFPCAVLAHRYPHVPNWGDITKFREWPDAAIDVLVGGTPCQSFSVAGLRGGMADPRGNLALVYLAIADRYRPEWLVWENVPGVLSSDGGRDFAAFVGGLAKLGYHAAWRVLDAQYVRVDGYERAVPQRRRRVFVVGHSRDWRRAAAVLFERESLQGHPAPRRQAGEGIAPTISARPTGGGGLGTDFDCDGGLIAASVAPTLDAHFGDKQGLEDQHINGGCGLFVAHALRAGGFDAGEDGTGRGTPLVPVTYSIMPMNSGTDYKARKTDVAQPVMVGGPVGGNQGGDYVVAPQVAASLTRGAGSAGKGGYAGRRQEDDVNIVAFQANAGRDFTADENRSPPMRSEGIGGSSSMAVAFDMRGREGGAQFEGPHETANIRAASGGSSKSFVAALDLRNAVRNPDAPRRPGGSGSGLGTFDDVAYTLSSEASHGVAHNWAVRRLTPLECERLQGFPDGYTAVPFRNKPAADGPRYKALGNSMACNVMRWIGRRIAMVEGL